ncbi:substance-P receptor-like [Oppia nitens]|uniref:substance-P receptor-like n=1 Tax=Oppia nitens TaxID=1686743 RepID=UPI0023D9C570|nr:substance-P receptor-like [Oppia nitens]
MDPRSYTPTNVTDNGVDSNGTVPLPPLDALEWPLQMFLIGLYSTTAGLSFSGNIVTIVVLLKGKRCAKDVRKFLINLSVADIGMSLFSIPFTYTLYMFGHWIFPPIMCPIVNFVQLTALVVSVYTLAAIGVDRYFAIVHPLRASVSWFKSHRTLVICCIWLTGISIGCTQLFISESKPFTYGDRELYDCRETWAQGSNSGKIYTIIVFCLTFILPMIVLSFVYTLMGCALIRHHMPGNETIQQQFASKRIKVIKMLSTVVSLFIICWLPIQIFGLLVWFYPTWILQYETRLQYYTFVGMYFFCHWISMAHRQTNGLSMHSLQSMANPNNNNNNMKINKRSTLVNGNIACIDRQRSDYNRFNNDNYINNKSDDYNSVSNTLTISYV